VLDKEAKEVVDDVVMANPFYNDSNPRDYDFDFDEEQED